MPQTVSLLDLYKQRKKYIHVRNVLLGATKFIAAKCAYHEISYDVQCEAEEYTLIVKVKVPNEIQQRAIDKEKNLQFLALGNRKMLTNEEIV